VMVEVKPQWAEAQTGRKFTGFFLEIFFPEGGEDTAQAKKLYIDDRGVEPDFDRLYVEVSMIVVDEVTETVKVYRKA